MGTRKAHAATKTRSARRRAALTGGAPLHPSARPVRPGLADEAQRYLAAVDAFRREGVAITWRAEPHAPPGALRRETA